MDICVVSTSRMVSSVAVSTGGASIFSNYGSSGYMPRSGIARLHGNSIFSFLRNLYTVLHHRCTNLHPTNSVVGFPFSHARSSIYYLY